MAISWRRRFATPLLCLVTLVQAALGLTAVVPQARAQGFDSGGFNGGPALVARGFSSGGFNSRPGFNNAGFNAAPLPALGAFGGICGRLLVPVASLSMMSRGFSDTHAGVDLVADIGTPIRAAAPGIVAHVGQDEAYGNFVDIRHPGGITTRYGHLSAFAPTLTAGAAVLMGSVIGQVGTTGHSTGPHLHFEVRVNGIAVDPKPFLVGDNCPNGAPRQEILEARDTGRRATVR